MVWMPTPCLNSSWRQTYGMLQFSNPFRKWECNKIDWKLKNWNPGWAQRARRNSSRPPLRSGATPPLQSTPELALHHSGPTSRCFRMMDGKLPWPCAQRRKLKNSLFQPSSSNLWNFHAGKTLLKLDMKTFLAINSMRAHLPFYFSNVG